MKRLFPLLLILLAASLARAQNNPVQATLNSVSTGACTPTSCLTIQIPSGIGSVGISVVGSSGTVVFEGLDVNGNYVALNVTPSNSTTAVSTTTVSDTKMYQVNPGGYSAVRVRLTATGSAVVTMNPSTASARIGGGGGSGTGCVTSGSSGQVLFDDGSGGCTSSSALTNGTTAATQTQADASTKVATTAYVDTGLGTKATGTLTSCGTANAIGIFTAATTVGCGNADLTYLSHTYSLGASGTLNLSAASATGGFKIPLAAGAAPTADAWIAFNSTTHNMVFGSNGSTRAVASTLDTVSDPAANKSFTMGANTLNFNMTADWGSGYGVSIVSNGSNAATGPLFQLSTGASTTHDVAQFCAQGTSNCAKVTSAGLLTTIGTGAIDATKLSGNLPALNGASLTSVNAATLGGATFASPGPIGGTTPDAGTFTSVTLPASGGVAGGVTCTAGTAIGHATASTVTLECPATATAYEMKLPTASSTGIMHAADSSNVNTLSISAIVGADMTNNTVTATQLAAQYSKWTACGSRGIGDGLNAITAGTYLQFACVNDTGVTVTITGIHCWTDNAGTSTLAAANNAATALLTGAVTCNNTKASGGAAGTQSATVTLASGDAISFTFVADGTSKQTNWTVSGTY